MARKQARLSDHDAALQPASKRPKTALVAAAVGVAIIAIAAIGGLRQPGPLPGSGDISNTEAKALIKRGARIVDVRTAEEFAAGHIPGAENVPVEDFPAAAASWDKTKPVILYCATGERSLYVFRQLAQAGFERLYNLQAGIIAWDGEVTSGNEDRVAQGKIGPLPSGLPAMYEFYTDW